MRPRTTAFALLALALSALLGTGEAVAVSFEDDLLFTTTGQSLFGPGTDPIKSVGFSLDIVNQTIPQTKIGKIVTSTIRVPNPLRAAYDAAFAACRALGFSASLCRNGGFGIPGLGPRPPATIAATVKNGAELTASAALRFGLAGNLTVGSGDVEVAYPTRATLKVSKTTVAPGEMFAISLDETPGDATMATQFASVDASLSAYVDARARVDLTAFVANAGGTVNVLNFDTPLITQELLGAKVDTSAGALQLRILGNAFNVIEEGIGTNIPWPSGIPLVSFPLGDVQLFIPDLDTPGTSVFDGTKIVNTKLPEDRTSLGSGLDPPNGTKDTDFAKVDVDVDVLDAFAGAPLGAVAGIPLVASIEANVLDFDVGAFFGLGQTLTFEPDLQTELLFDVPTMVETAPGSGIFELVTSKPLDVGKSLRVIHPGTDLTVTPLYTLDNTFENQTDWLMSLAITEAFLQLKLLGFAWDLVPFALPRDITLLETVLPLGNPVTLGKLSDRSFSLEGFETARGNSFVVAAKAPVAVPQPHAIVLVGVGLSALICMTRRRRGRS